MPERFPEVLARQIDKIILKDTPEVRFIGGDLGYLKFLEETYGPWTTISLIREKEMERLKGKVQGHG